MARTNKKLSTAAKKKAATRHNWTLQFCWNYERMQASGFAYSMIPVLKELYDTNDEVCENLERHMQFYNSHPGASAVIMGASVALEEGYQPDLSDSIKVGLMGPMASLGDTVQAVLVQPLAYIISAGLAAEGNLLSLLVLVIPFLLMFWVRWPLFNWGYKRSVGIIDDISGESDFKLLSEAAQILGLTVIGGFVPSMIGVSLKYEYIKEIDGVAQSVRLQDTLDGILPYMLPIVLVAACYALLKKAKWTPVAVIGALAVVCFVLGAVGIL
jgi:PTS system mannose-specific IID component